jgi:hypothetical protein
MGIFLILNGMGVAFLLYVLAHLWREGHRQREAGGISAMEFERRSGADVLVVKQPISRSSDRSFTVIRFPVQSCGSGTNAVDEYRATGTADPRVRPISTIRASSADAQLDYDAVHVLKEGRQC